MVRRLFNVKDEFPAEWRRFEVRSGSNAPILTIVNVKDRMPYVCGGLVGGPASIKLWGRDGQSISGVDLFLDTPGEEPNDTPEEGVEGKAHWEAPAWDKTWRFQWRAAGATSEWLALLVETNLGG